MILHRARRAAVALLCGTFVLALACGARQKVETAAAKALIPPSTSEQIGLQVQKELQQQGVRFVDDPAITGWVDQLARPILAIAREARPDVGEWKLRVIDDPKTVNAFATGGGDLYVYSGLLLAASSGAEVAGVLAHEVGHVVLYHIERQLVDTYGLQALTQLALGQSGGVAQQIATAVATKGALLAHSRSSEAEADAWGTVHVAQAGYDPHGLASFFKKLLAEEGNSPQILGWLSDHPTTPSRVEEVERIIREKNLKGGSNGPPGLDQVQARIKARPLPPAPKGSSAAAQKPVGS